MIKDITHFYEVYDDFKVRDRAWYNGDRDDATKKQLEAEFEVISAYAKKHSIAILKPYTWLASATITVTEIPARD